MLQTLTLKEAKEAYELLKLFKRDLFSYTFEVIIKNKLVIIKHRATKDISRYTWQLQNKVRIKADT
jgi:hypothetical protein